MARAIGVSNYSLAQIDELTAATRVTPEVNQIRWSPKLFNPVELAGHRERGIVLEGYSALSYAAALTTVVDDLQSPGNGSNGRPARTNGH